MPKCEQEIRWVRKEGIRKLNEDGVRIVQVIEEKVGQFLCLVERVHDPMEVDCLTFPEPDCHAYCKSSDDGSNKRCHAARETKTRPFNEKCPTCEFFYRDEQGYGHCHAFSRGTEECCEVEDFAYYKPKKGDKPK